MRVLSKLKKPKATRILGGALGLLLALSLVLLPAARALAVPPLPHQFYGTVTIGTELAPEGTTVSAQIGGVEYVSTTVDASGKYGYDPLFQVPADDPNTAEVKEGGVAGETVEFYIGLGEVKANETAEFEVWGETELDLTVERLEYGDAPDPTYPTLLASDGARHFQSPGAFLGLLSDGNNLDWELDANVPGLDLFDDGLVTTTITAGNPAQTVTFEVTDLMAPSYDLRVNILIDLNGDGDWIDAGEHAVVNQLITTTVAEQVFDSTPFSTVGATPGETWLRITLTRHEIQDPPWDGTMADAGLGCDEFEFGETEDWEITIESAGGALSASEGPNTPADHDWYWDPDAEAYNEMLQIALTADATEDITLNSVTVKASGTGNDATGIDFVDLVVDDSITNGLVDDPAELPAIATGTYLSDDGSLTLTIPGGHTITKGTTEYFIIDYQMNSSPSVGDTFIATVTDVSAVGASTGLSIPVSGLPIAPATKTTVVGAPTVTNLTGASDITSNSARLNGEVTNTGGEDPTVHIYWGTTDGGTTASNWDNDEDLGATGAGTFVKDISGLSLSTPYFYRCYATNSGGEDWADSSATFDTLSGPTVESTSPAADAPGVAVGTRVSVTFSKAMDSATITTDSFTLDSVSGSISHDGNTYTFTPDADLTESTTYSATLSTAITDAAGNPLAAEYTWSFTTAAVNHSLTMAVVGEGTVSPESGTYAEGDMTIAATPASGWEFSAWSTADMAEITDDSSAETTLTLDKDKTVTATFTQITYDLTVDSTAGGSVTTPGEDTFTRNAGTVVDLVAEAAEGYGFDNWTGDTGDIADASAASTTITMNGDYSITANFAEEGVTYDLTVDSSAGGSVTTPGENTFARDAGTAVDLLAVAEDGYQFDNWTGDTGTIADTSAASTTITMNGDYEITANFVESLGDLIARNPEGKPLQLGAGTYSGDVTITQPITITGSEEGTVIHGGITIGELTGDSNVTIENLTITDYAEVGIKIVKVRSADTFIFRNNTILGVEGTEIGIQVDEVKDGGILTIEQNAITGNETGIKLEAAVAEVTIKFNDITGNTVGLDLAAGGSASAATNWWGDISGPKQATTNPRGAGDEVSGDADYQPWLTRQFATAQVDNIAYFGYAWVNLSAGWNIMSTPITLDPACDTWGEYVALGDPDLDIHGTSPAYYFNSQTQAWVAPTSSYALNPCDALYIRMASADTAPILYSADVSVPSRDLYAGWNLVSLAYVGGFTMAADEALSTIYTVTGDLTGYSLVVSPPVNQDPWIYTRDGSSPPDMKRAEGYWVFMTNPGTLAGFAFTPMSLPQ